MFPETGSRKFALPAEILRMAHDIRSPLSALNIVLDGLNLPAPKNELIRNALHRINNIANDLVRHGKQSQNGVETQTKFIMPADTVRSLLAEKRLRYRNHTKIEITSNLRPAYGRFVAMEAGDLARTLSNLIDNAVEACPSAGWIHVSMGVESDNLWIQVEDNGVGMSPEILEAVGRRGFTRGKVDGEAGMGLGVYSARRSVEKLGGRLAIESCVGRGSIFTLTLPTVPTPKWWATKVSVSADQIILSLVEGFAPELRRLVSRIKAVEPTSRHIQCRDGIDYTRRARMYPNAICIFDSRALNYSRGEALPIMLAHHQSFVLLNDGAELRFGEVSASLNAKIITQTQSTLLPVLNAETVEF